MLRLERTHQFKKDAKLMVKRGKKIEKLRTIVTQLVHQEKLDRRYKDHLLTGNYKGSRECHVEPDWLLIYTLTTTTIKLERTGTHSDLFN